LARRPPAVAPCRVPDTIPAAWGAVTDARRVLLWHVIADNEPVYTLLER
jgi:hypothetical protein